MTCFGAKRSRFKVGYAGGRGGNSMLDFDISARFYWNNNASK